MGRFEGKVVLITGGARGQERSHALAFARKGADVALCDIAADLDTVPHPLSSVDDMTQTAKLVEDLDRACVTVTADVRDHDQIAAFVEQALTQLGRVDFLLANAGVFTVAPITELSTAAWRELVDTNLTGVFHAVQAVLPTMLAQGNGRIVATASMVGKLGYPHLAHYCASKWQVIWLIKSVAREVGAHGITANVVCPTNCDTDMIQNQLVYTMLVLGKDDPGREDLAEIFVPMHDIPVPWVRPEDISEAMLSLCSDAARYITGETLSVAAGINAANAA